MAYRVELAKSAEVELEELYLWVIERAPNQGAAWFNGLEQAILSLEQHPKRCRIAPESFDLINRFVSSTTVVVLMCIACSSRSMKATTSFESSTSGVERGKDRHRVSSEASSATAHCLATATRLQRKRPT
jgi:plasmid stabilization system protein ParE